MLFLKYVTEKQSPYFSGKQTSLLQFDIGKHWMDKKIGKNTFYVERMVFNEFPLKRFGFKSRRRQFYFLFMLPFNGRRN